MSALCTLMFASVAITKHGFAPAPRKMFVWAKKGEIIRRVSSSKCVAVLLVYRSLRGELLGA